jgi:CpeT/CpcT family protein DUF1001
MNDLRTLTSLLGAALLSLLAGCGGQQAQRQIDMAEIGRTLPGLYDNLEQIRAGGDAADLPALRIAIVPIYAPLVGKNIFYLQEMAADDARRVTAQRVLSLEVTPKGQVLEGIFALNEPNRWRDGHEKLDLFKSLLPNDLRLAQGCEIEWQRKGKKFEGTNDPARCRITQRGSGLTARQESHIELDEDGIAFSDTVIEVSGNRQPPTPTWYRFRRRAH